jgi:hypothetical protein
MASSLFILTLSLFSLLSLSIAFPDSDQFLDVAASIRATHHALRPDLHPQEVQETATQLPTSSLYLKIHTRLAFTPPGWHPNYESLTESRLARDSSRVNSLLSKLELSLRGISPADLEPDAESTSSVKYGYGQEDLVAPVSSGTSQGSGEYFSRVGVGSPPRSYSMVIDTGSDVSWLQCQPCSDCYQQSDPIYSPGAKIDEQRIPI